jgi:hypothetical protein
VIQLTCEATSQSDLAILFYSSEILTDAGGCYKQTTYRSLDYKKEILW